MTMLPDTLPPPAMVVLSRRLSELADTVAMVWAPALGAEAAHEAARNAVMSVGDISVFESAETVLAHRRLHFGLAVTDEEIAALAFGAQVVALSSEWLS